MDDKATAVQELKDLAEKFRAERNWGKHHTAKNLAASISIEAAELLEHYQWGEYAPDEAKGEIEGELADIVIYCLFFAVSNGIDIASAVERKIEKSSKKYPVSTFNHETDDPKEYWRIKNAHRKGPGAGEEEKK